jgi:hypothetical protein
MFDAATTEFPFVGALPKREKSKLGKVWDHFAQVRAIVAEKGMLVPQHLVANLLGLSKQRIGQLVDDGRLEGVDVHGTRYITEVSVVAFAKVERRRGRPVKLGSPLSEALSASREALENTSK